MGDELDEIFPPILDARQFTRDDVLAVTELTAGQLKGLLDREQVRLNDNHNPGSGRRRLYTGGDILKIVSANVSNSIGFPLRWSYLLADQVEQRATSEKLGMFVGDNRRFALALYPNKAGDNWAFTPVFDGKPVSELPVAFHYVNVSTLIEQTLAKLEALVAEKEIPSFDLPEPKFENPYSPENDFFLMWGKDAEGRRIRTGLNLEESEELNALEEADLHEGYVRGADARDRYIELHGKHERARLNRVNDEQPARYRAFWKKTYPGVPLPDELKESDRSE